MWRRLRITTSPGWLVLHLVTLVLIVAMVLLGRWQLDVSDSKHFNLQNFGYALQWWAFSAFVAVMWVRIVRDAGLPRAEGRDGAALLLTGDAEGGSDEPNPVEYRRYVMPTSADSQPAGDSTLGAYNDYLARLAANDEFRRNTPAADKLGRKAGGTPR